MSSIARHVCRGCRAEVTNSRSLRAFSTTATQSSIPPEAPTFVDVPQSFQPDLITPRRQKGILPVPREIFPPRQPDKPSADYIGRATRNKLAKNVVPESQMSELEKYKSRMAIRRKRHLTEGLLELHHRKLSMTRQVTFRSEQKQAERNRLISQGDRIDERLTNSSIPRSMKPGKGPQLPRKRIYLHHLLEKTKLEKDAAENGVDEVEGELDREREVKRESVTEAVKMERKAAEARGEEVGKMWEMKTIKLAKKAAVERRKTTKLARKATEKEEERGDALHTLYMNARDFITTEKQLDAEIEKAFTKGPNPEWANASTTGESIWNSGPPPSITELLQASSSRVKKDFTMAGLGDSAEKFRLDQERMKKIAEELSGGKI